MLENWQLAGNGLGVLVMLAGVFELTMRAVTEETGEIGQLADGMNIDIETSAESAGGVPKIPSLQNLALSRQRSSTEPLPRVRSRSQLSIGHVPLTRRKSLDGRLGVPVRLNRLRKIQMGMSRQPTLGHL